jgi:hypothetical protein
MSQKQAIYILIALGAVAIVYVLATEPVDDEDCGCGG